MYLDEKVDSDTYHLKLEKYKKEQRKITSEMQAHIDSDESVLITAKAVLDLAKRAKGIFLSSKLDEKRQFLRLVFSNCKLDGEKLLPELHKPFFSMTKNVGSGWWS